MPIDPTSTGSVEMRDLVGLGGISQLASVTLGADGIIDTPVPGGYSDLILVLMARCSVAGVNDSPVIRFNNDSGGNYTAMRSIVDGTTPSLGGGITTSATGCILTRFPANGALANFYGHGQLYIPGYTNTGWVKLLTGFGGTADAVSTTGVHVLGFANVWNSTAAINRIQVMNGSFGNLTVGSQLRVYGLV